MNFTPTVLCTLLHPLIWLCNEANSFLQIASPSASVDNPPLPVILQRKYYADKEIKSSHLSWQGSWTQSGFISQPLWIQAKITGYAANNNTPLGRTGTLPKTRHGGPACDATPSGRWRNHGETGLQGYVLELGAGWWCELLPSNQITSDYTSPADLKERLRCSKLFWFPEDKPVASLQETLLHLHQYCAQFPSQSSNMVQIQTNKSCFSDTGERKVALSHSEPVKPWAKVAFMLKRLCC